MSYQLTASSPYQYFWSKREPRAQWMQVREDVVAERAERPAYFLRKEFVVSGAVKNATIKATAQGIYNIYIDGNRIGDKVLTPDTTDYRFHIAVQEYDVTDALKPGTHTVVIELADGFFRSSTGVWRVDLNYENYVAALFEMDIDYTDGTLQPVDSDLTWKVSPSHILAADLMEGQVEDRRLFDPSIKMNGFDDSAWDTPILGSTEAALVREFAPPIRAIEELQPVSITTLSGGAIVIDFGQNINGWIRLSNLGPRDTKIEIKHAEGLYPDGHVNMESMILSLPGAASDTGGQRAIVTSSGVKGDLFENYFTTQGFQFVEIIGHPGPITAEDISAVVVHSDLRRTGWFTSDNENLNWLHEATVWSFRDNMCGVPTDCPTRERAGWTGDWQLFSPTAAFLYDVLDATRKWMADVVVGQTPDGVIPNIAPSDKKMRPEGEYSLMNGSAGWGDAIVSTPLDMYNAYGDLKLARESWGAMVKWMDFAYGRAKNLRHPGRAAARPVPADHEEFIWDAAFHWGEWLAAGDALPTKPEEFFTPDHGITATAYMYRSTLQMIEIGKLLGKSDAELRKYSDIAPKIKDAWQKEYILSSGLLSEETQANYLRALHFDLAPIELRENMGKRLVVIIRDAGNHLGTGFLATPYLLTTLADIGYTDVAYDLLFQDTVPSWMYMKKKGATTIWESWNGIDDDGKLEASLNHYSKGAVISFLHQYIAGLKPIAPAYKSFAVKPHLSNKVNEIDLKLDSPNGRVEVQWQRTNKKFDIRIVVPTGSTATAELPDGSTHTLTSGENKLSCALSR
jgi:alpha-L-rhamnosidase